MTPLEPIRESGLFGSNRILYNRFMRGGFRP
jgi:hypothetical protein